MWLKNFFQSLTAISSHQRPIRRRPSPVRLSIETLEDRVVPSYSVIDLGTLGGTLSRVADINASGQIVGSSSRSSGGSHAFLWQHGIMTDLGSLGGGLGGGYSVALGINDVGQIAGYSTAADGIGHAFLLTPEDTDGNGTPDRWFRDSDGDGDNDLMLDLGPNSVANDVNNAGQVVGYSGTAGAERASLWQNGAMTDLGTLGGLTSSATAINDAGQVTGNSDTPTGESSGFLWQGGVMHDMGAPSVANDVNQSGQVAGGSYSYATLWTPTTPNGATGSFQSLGVLPPDPDYLGLGYHAMFQGSTGAGVNDLGSVVGSSTTTYNNSDDTASFDDSRGFVWANGIMEDLGGWGLQNATAINNAGQIVGNDPNDRAFLLTPQSATTSPSNFSVSGFPSSTTAGTAGSFTVTAKNTDGTMASGYTGTVHFSSSDGQAGLPGDYTFMAADQGVHTFSAILKTADTQSITATDTTTGGLTGSEAGITVTPAAATQFAVSAPAGSTAGSAFSVTLTALDPFNNSATGYTGAVHFTSSDGQAVLPANYAFTAADAGVHAFTGVILKTAGSQTVTATDTLTSAITGGAALTVKPAPASTMIVTGFPSPTTAGVAGNCTVRLKDPYGNTASGYAGTVHFTSSDGQAALPANYTFTAADAGVHTFSATLKTAGTQSLTATDTTTASLTGTDGGITVKPAAASKFLISAPASVHSGVPFSLTLTVQDAYGNVVTGYTGTIHFTSTDKTATLPADYTFTAADQGVHPFSGLVLRKKGMQKITITDTLNSSITASVIENVL